MKESSEVMGRQGGDGTVAVFVDAPIIFRQTLVRRHNLHAFFYNVLLAMLSLIQSAAVGCARRQGHNKP